MPVTDFYSQLGSIVNGFFYSIDIYIVISTALHFSKLHLFITPFLKLDYYNIICNNMWAKIRYFYKFWPSFSHYCCFICHYIIYFACNSSGRYALLISEIPIGSKVELEVRYSGRTLSFDSDVKLIINNTILITPIVFNDQTVGFNDNCRINLIVN